MLSYLTIKDVNSVTKKGNFGFARRTVLRVPAHQPNKHVTPHKSWNFLSDRTQWSFLVQNSSATTFINIDASGTDFVTPRSVGVYTYSGAAVCPRKHHWYPTITPHLKPSFLAFWTEKHKTMRHLKRETFLSASWRHRAILHLGSRWRCVTFTHRPLWPDRESLDTNRIRGRTGLKPGTDVLPLPRHEPRVRGCQAQSQVH